MSNLNEMINGMPQIQRQPRMPAPQPGAGDMTNFLSLQMMVNRELQATQSLHRDLSKLVRTVEDIVDRNDTPGFTKSVRDMIESLGDRLENPVINMEFPTEELVAVKQAIQALRFEAKDSVSVTNISEVTKAVNELKPLLSKLASCIEDSKSEAPESVTLDKQTLAYLKNLQFLDTDAKNPLAVRLSDGKEFINQLKSVDSGIRAMTGSSGNNFLTPEGNPTKAKLDADGNLRVAVDYAAGTATVTSVDDMASSTTLLAADSTRKGFRIFNDSTVSMYLKYGATASLTDYTVRLTPSAYFEENMYNGRLDAIWASNASGSAKVTSIV